MYAQLECSKATSYHKQLIDRVRLLRLQMVRIRGVGCGRAWVIALSSVGTSSAPHYLLIYASYLSLGYVVVPASGRRIGSAI
jgi:hypothetical protein